MTRKKKSRTPKPARRRTKAGISLPPQSGRDAYVAKVEALPKRWRVDVVGYSFTEGTRYWLPCVSLSSEGPAWRERGWAVTLRVEFWKWCGWIAVGRWAE